MSFPNSGASFTLNIVSAASNTTVATNYGWDTPEEELDGNCLAKTNLPVFPMTLNSSNHNPSATGPFWWQPNTMPTRRQPPPVTVLTKTYCGGYCHDCKPLASVETPHSFMMHCATADAEVGAGDTEEPDAARTRERYIYDYNDMDRVVHLIRNPLENVVSRYHSDLTRLVAENTTEWMERYTYDSAGFQTFVPMSPIRVRNARIVMSINKSCDWWKISHATMDIFRYVQWHNLAFITTNNYLNLPSLVVHYEDYNTNLEGTLQSLLDFLELPDARAALNGVAAPTGLGALQAEKSYSDYYTQDQIDRIHTAIMMLASPLTWHSLERYFHKTD